MKTLNHSRQNQPRKIESHLAPVLAMGAILANAGMDIATKLVAADLSSWQGVFLRWSYAAVILCVLYLMRRPKVSDTRNIKVHILRLGLNLIGSVSLFYALANLDLWLTLTIFFLEPMVTIVLAALVLGEMMGSRRIISLILSICGVLVAINPGTIAEPVDTLALLAAMIGTTAWAAMHLVTERLGNNQSSGQLVMVLAISTSVVALGPTIATWQTITLWHHAVMICVATLGTVYSYLWISAIKESSAAQIAVFSYLTIPLALLAGHLFFGEIITAKAIFGCGLILVAVFVSSSQLRTFSIKKFF